MDVGYNSRRDLGNYVKAIGDILQQARVVLNDKQFHTIHMDWVEGVEGVRIEVWPFSAEATKGKPIQVTS